MYEDVVGRMVEGKHGRREQGRSNGSPKVHCSQSRDHPEPHSINLVALSLPWPANKTRRTWVRTAPDMDASSQTPLECPLVVLRTENQHRDSREENMRPRTGLNGSQQLPLTNLVKNTSFPQE